jgi:type VI secretion system secreted protein Hcp
MAFDAFAKIGDIKGESLDDKHKDWIEVLSFSAGITRRSQGGRPNIEDFKIVKKVDAASPLIFDAACEGGSVGNATFVARKAGKGQQEFLVIKMNDVIITSVQHTGAATDLPLEQVSLDFRSLEMEVTPENADGSQGKPVTTVCNSRRRVD